MPQRLKRSVRQIPPGTPSRRQAGHFAGIPFYVDDIDTSRWMHRLPSSTDTMLLSEMEELETVLARRGASAGRGGQARGRRDRLSSNSGRRPAWRRATGLSRASGWSVATAAAASCARPAGFEFAGTEPEFTGYSAQVAIADPEKLSPGRTLTATGMYFQSQPGFLVMQEFDGGAAHGAAAVTLEQLQQVLRRVSGTDVTISALHVASTWTDRARQATRYRNGRVLLAGDAAHIHAPLGGQGLNLGIGDAHEPGLEACRHHTRPCTGGFAGHLSHRAASDRRPGAGLVARAGRRHAARSPCARAQRHPARLAGNARWRHVYRRQGQGRPPCITILAAATRWSATASPTSNWKTVRRLASACSMAAACCWISGGMPR